MTILTPALGVSTAAAKGRCWHLGGGCGRLSPWSIHVISGSAGGGKNGRGGEEEIDHGQLRTGHDSGIRAGNQT